MAPALNSQVDALYPQIRKRLIESGEWDRIISTLKERLSENGWLDKVRDQSKETARAMNPLSFEKLLEDIDPQARSTVPPAIQKEITILIRAFVDKQLQ